MSKPRLVKDYDKLPEDVILRLKQKYPYGYADNLVSFTNKEGNKVSALPFETDDVYYLIRMTVSQANKIIEDDDDYDKDGNLKEDFSIDIPSSEFGDSSDEEEEEEDEDDVSVRVKNRRKSDDDYDDDEDEDPSESPDYY